MHTVAAVVDQGALTFDFAIPCEIFGLDRSDIADPWYELLVVGAGDRRIRTQTGFFLDAPYGLDALGRADTIVLPGWADPDLEPSDALKEALVAAYDRGARLVSLCTGAFALAATGLLDDRRATTHWMYAERSRAATRASGSILTCSTSRTGGCSRRPERRPGSTSASIW